MKRAEVSLEKAEARVEFDDGKVSAADLAAAAIDRLGFRARVVSVSEPGAG